MTSKKFSLTKRIAKHGSQAIIVIPRFLENKLKPGTIVKLAIDVIDSPEEKEVVEGIK
ncbi:hypothetical protein J4447_01305 [Candidatus Pacearchaeota archaeon]|nr:hypothetical protein [Candidatus Pacearchaeota archaeon]